MRTARIPAAAPTGSRAAAVAVALAADRILGEPPAPLHPVARFGAAMQALESRLWSDNRAAGALHLLLGAGAAAAAGAAASRGGSGRRFWSLASATYLAVASRSLCQAAGEVQLALEGGDLDSARRLVGGLVGRRTAELDAAEVARAAVESVAENTVDAVTAPMLWAVWGGPAGVLAYRAVNTLDAMVGHRSARYERFGWASARTDDLANWVPARLTAATVAALRPRRATAIVKAVRRQAPEHPSPNAGVVEAAFAAALAVSLGGVNDYSGRFELRPLLGSGDRPAPRHIAEACRLSRQVSVALCAACLAASWLGSRMAR